MLAKYLILIAYFSVLFLIGLLASRRIKNIKDYYVGGKKMGYWVVAFSARATGESGWLLLGLTAMGAMSGLNALWVVIGEVIGVAIAWFFMAKPFKKLTDEYDSITIPDYLVSRFNASGNTLRVLAATTLTVFVAIYVSAQIDLTGQAFEKFLDWDYFVGALVGFVIVVAYTFSGGFVAVAWSDLFQGVVILLCLVGLPVFVYFSISPEHGLFQALGEIDPALLDFWGSGKGLGLQIATIVGFFGIGLGFLGSPQVFVRFMSIKDEKEINRGRWVAILFTIVTDTAAVFIGILGRYVFTESGMAVEEALGHNAENVLALLVESFLPLALSGLFIAAVLSAIMSTIDSLLVVASSAIVRDFYQQIYRPNQPDADLSGISRWVTLALALAALIIALSVAVWVPGRSVFWFPIFGWSGIAATFCPMIILSLFYRGYTEKGAIVSMITGFLCVPIIKFGLTPLAGIGPYLEAMDVLAPSFVISMIAGYLVSAARPNK